MQQRRVPKKKKREEKKKRFKYSSHLRLREVTPEERESPDHLGGCWLATELVMSAGDVIAGNKYFYVFLFYPDCPSTVQFRNNKDSFFSIITLSRDKKRSDLDII